MGILWDPQVITPKKEMEHNLTIFGLTIVKHWAAQEIHNRSKIGEEAVPADTSVGCYSTKYLTIWVTHHSCT